jgi:hypothetical protein
LKTVGGPNKCAPIFFWPLGKLIDLSIIILGTIGDALTHQTSEMAETTFKDA